MSRTARPLPHRPRAPRPWLPIVLLLAATPLTAETPSPGAPPGRAGGLSPDLTGALERAGENRGELERALETVPEDQRDALGWLIARMPAGDLTALDAEFLVEHCTEAHRAWRESSWHDSISEELFREAILPYACVDERRDRWRADFHARFAPLVADAKSPGHAATILNQQIFSTLGVKYSTKRPKANQSPYESIDAGLASCSGLSVLLITACRAVGVPARFVGTPLWSDGSGNHSWVEVWDGSWRFTGAAEPAGDALDQAWFTGRARGATRSDPRHAIYATTWRWTPLTFPMVWSPGDQSVQAVDVTDRYTAPADRPEGSARVRFRITSAPEGNRIAVPIVIEDQRDGSPLFEGTSRDEGFDANDHVTAVLPLGTPCRLVFPTRVAAPVAFDVERDEQLVSAAVGPPTPSDGPQSDAHSALGALEKHLARASGATLLPAASEAPWLREALSEHEARRAADLLWDATVARTRETAQREIEGGVLEAGSHRMPFWTKAFGERPAAGHSLWISMHGGGGAPAEVNDRQWENQKKLYTLEEGIYLVPRAPTDTWNLWHQAHIDRFFDRLISNLVLLGRVDPDRVYIVGYSAGGDGVYQLAPRLADRLAGAGMFAGHPNETRPDGLRNLPFALYVGGNDDAYRRNEVARSWREELERRRVADPDGYVHQVRVPEGKGHWMDGEEKAALPWLASHTRVRRPARVVWLQDDVTHPRFYWLRVDEPRARSRIVVERDGAEIRIVESQGIDRLTVRLDDTMVDLDAPVTVRQGDETVFEGPVPRTIETIARTLAERNDPTGVYFAELTVEFPAASAETPPDPAGD